MRESESHLVQEFSKVLQLSPITCRLLIQRGVKSLDEARDFLNPSLKNLPDPFLFKDMDKAAARIEQAVFNNEPICVYGDYDVDGTTGASVLTQFFKDIGASVFFYIPHRMTEGYGLSENVIEVLKEKNAKLVITCDCGTAKQKKKKRKFFFLVWVGAGQTKRRGLKKKRGFLFFLGRALFFLFTRATITRN